MERTRDRRSTGAGTVASAARTRWMQRPGKGIFARQGLRPAKESSPGKGFLRQRNIRPARASSGKGIFARQGLRLAKEYSPGKGFGKASETLHSLGALLPSGEGWRLPRRVPCRPGALSGTVGSKTPPQGGAPPGYDLFS